MLSFDITTANNITTDQLYIKKNGILTNNSRVTGSKNAVIRKYGLMVCRQSFREKASEIGFHKYR